MGYDRGDASTNDIICAKKEPLSLISINFANDTSICLKKMLLALYNNHLI